MPNAQPTSTPVRVYLAGPDVFYPEPFKIAECKKRVLAALGLEGVFPLDQALETAGLASEEAALAIGRANEALIRSCGIVIANMEPWHGPSMDVGTAYEMGYGRALGKIVVGYSPERRRFADRVREFLKRQRGRAGAVVEDFGRMADNLMLVNAVAASAKEVRGEVPASFEEAARLARRLWEERGQSGSGSAG